MELVSCDANFSFGIFSIYTKQTGQKDQVANDNNTFTVCPNEVLSTATSTSTASSHSLTSTPTSLASSTAYSAHGFTSNRGAVIGGGVAAGIVFLALVLLVCWFFYQKRRQAPLPVVPDYTPVPFAGPTGQGLTDVPHDPFYSPPPTSRLGMWGFNALFHALL
jgi:hypothetical protein